MKRTAEPAVAAEAAPAVTDWRRHGAAAVRSGTRSAVRAAVLALALVAGPFAAAPAAAQPVTAPAASDGIDVGRKSRAIGLASAEDVEKSAALEYQQLIRQAAQQGALAPPDHPQTIRLRTIAQRLIRESTRFNERAAGWKWEVNLIGSKQINAFCMPGGKIAFFSGILSTLQLTDDEVAIVMGHEIAHALREHGRERVGKMRLAQIGTVIASIGGALLGFGDLGGQVASGAAQLTMLKYGRDDETEADLVGLDIAARAGFDPRAGIVVWQKMSAASKGQPPQWLSSHPSHAARIGEISKALDKTMPLYARARGESLAALPPYRSNVGQPIPWPLITARK
ncbi:MAG: M48 family metallopeptidase [Lautropia sp.]